MPVIKTSRYVMGNDFHALPNLHQHECRLQSLALQILHCKLNVVWVQGQFAHIGSDSEAGGTQASKNEHVNSTMLIVILVTGNLELIF